MIASTAVIGKNVTIKPGVIIEDNVIIGDNCYLDYGCIIKENVTLGANSFVGVRCILGEFLQDFHLGRTNKKHPLVIGENALLRSETILYGDSEIGSHFQSGHRTTIREKANIGHHVNIGTLSDIQGTCEIGNYVRIHSNAFVAQHTNIKDFVWLFPCVIITDDPTPPSNVLNGATLEEFCCIGAGSVLLPGIHIGKDALVGAGTTVTKHVNDNEIVVGNPSKCVGNVERIKNTLGDSQYPWRYTFERGMPWENIGYENWLATLENIEDTE